MEIARKIIKKLSLQSGKIITKLNIYSQLALIIKYCKLNLFIE